MVRFNFKPKLKELHIPFKYPNGVGFLIYKFQYDSHNRIWNIYVPNIRNMKLKYSMSKAEGEKVLSFLNAIMRNTKITEDLLEVIHKAKITGSPMFFDFNSNRWRCRCIFDPTLIRYDQEYFEEMSEYVDSPFGKMHKV